MGMILLISVITLFTLYSFYKAFRFFYKSRLLHDTPTSKIRSASQGYIELHAKGKLLPGPKVIAPLSGSPCLWYEFKIETRQSPGESGHFQWSTVRSEFSHALFLLDDGTGECIVDPEGAQFIHVTKNVWCGDSAWTSHMPGKMGLFQELFQSGRYRYTEKRLHEGDSIYAIGQFNTVGGHADAPNTANEVRDLLSIWKKNQTDLLNRFDSNGDGQIDPKEWEQVRHTAKKQIRDQQLKRSTEPEIHVISQPTNNTRPFLISGQSQTFIVSRYRYLAAGFFIASLVSGGIVLWMVGVR